MAIIVEGPDGAEIEFPDGTAPAVMKQAIAKHYGGPKPAVPVAPTAPVAPQATGRQTMSDMAMSALSGLGKGTAEVTGDIASSIRGNVPFFESPTQRVGATLANALANLVPNKNLKAATVAAINPNAENFVNVQRQLTGNFKPQTTAGQFTQTAAEFVPIGAAAGPGGLGRRVLESAASGLASEAGGQMAKGTPFEGAARMAGALSTGAASNIVKNAKAVADAKKLIPSIEQIKNTSSNLYDAADQAGLIINGRKMRQEASSLQNILANEGIDKTLHPAAFAAMNRILNTKGNVTLKGIETLRKIATSATTTANSADRRMARIIVDHVDDFINNLKSSDTMGVDPRAATQMLSSARDLWKKSAKAQTIEDMITKAKNNPEGVLNFENAVKSQFTKLLNNPRGMARFSPEEQAAITKVAKGEPIQNMQRLIGKMAPTNPLAIFGSIGATAINPSALLAPVAGSIAKAASTMTAAKNARAASQLVRGGSNATKVPILDRRALLAAEMARQDQGQ
jgi:hypothetical protein